MAHPRDTAGAAAAADRRATPGGPVLVVEDDGPTRDALVGVLREAGFPVLASDEGRKALELATVMRPSVVVLDLTMPGMGGREFLTRRRDLPEVRRVPVIVVSGANAGDVQADAVLQKPLDVGALIATIRRLSRR
jgi:CheY-like chemotaxis protein